MAKEIINVTPKMKKDLDNYKKRLMKDNDWSEEETDKFIDDYAKILNIELKNEVKEGLELTQDFDDKLLWVVNAKDYMKFGNMDRSEFVDEDEFRDEAEAMCEEHPFFAFAQILRKCPSHFDIKTAWARDREPLKALYTDVEEEYTINSTLYMDRNQQFYVEIMPEDMVELMDYKRSKYKPYNEALKYLHKKHMLKESFEFEHDELADKILNIIQKNQKIKAIVKGANVQDWYELVNEMVNICKDNMVFNSDELPTRITNINELAYVIVFNALENEDRHDLAQYTVTNVQELADYLSSAKH